MKPNPNPPELRRDMMHTPFGQQVRKQHALEDLAREFEQRWQSLTAEFAARRSRIEREFM